MTVAEKITAITIALIPTNAKDFDFILLTPWHEFEQRWKYGLAKWFVDQFPFSLFLI
jgi:hypothetical protein